VFQSLQFWSETQRNPGRTIAVWFVLEKFSFRTCTVVYGESNLPCAASCWKVVIDVQIAQLCRKIDDSSDTILLRTVHAAGFIFPED
jgi:hypothetical protein